MARPARIPDDPITKAPIRHRARHAVDAAIAAGVALYRRQTCLPRLLPMLPAELADESEAARRRIVARLARALRTERMRGRAGHWTYDLNRHIALHQAYESERRQLRP
ncbi:hypothetical protein [Kaistia nematophila]|uniref:Uncharacterized protein n=1 Tax=Kaistia nematophila TaxID=2994654 RepID=A0A9X3E5E6_9HYPH|nr:hypothetical protein [Kaistia nematophila]MCX5572171.1 hypothetical protein [Kaistia nematophila]